MAEEEEAMEIAENGQDRTDKVERRANRIMKIFGQITECLEDVKVARIKEMLSQIIDICKNKGEKPVQELNKIYLEYLVMVEFRAGISVNLIKLSIQSFLMIEDDPDMLGKKVNDMFLEMILMEHPTLAIDMTLSDELLKTYFRLLNEGSEPALHMRLMTVGMFGVGKTTLLKRLCGRGITDVESTEGIDIFAETFEVKEEDGDWIISPEEEKEQIFNIRLQYLLRNYTEKEPEQIKNETIYYRKQTSYEQPESISSERQVRIDEPERKTVDFKDFRRKVDGSDLRQRADVETRKRKIRQPTISLWDFAGQSVYYSTHHFFLNDRSIYLLVLDLSKELDDFVEEKGMEFMPDSVIGNKRKIKCLDAFKFWMKSIYIYTKQKERRYPNESRPKYSPRIVLIGTHKDKISRKQLNGRSHGQYKDDYFEKALKSFTNKPIADLVHPTKFLVDNISQSPKEIAEFILVKREIFKIARNETPFLEEQIPANFIPLERAIFYSKKDKKQFLRLEELQKEVSELELPYSKREIQLFLIFQHAFGNVIYFNTDTLHDMVVLTPQWIVDVFKTFVSHKPNKRLSEQEKWNALKYQGILREELIDELLKPHKDLWLHKDQIVKYMEHMDVIVRPVLFLTKPVEPIDDSTDAPKESVRDLVCENFYIMPCLLPQIPPFADLETCFKKFKPSDENLNTPTLCLYFKECFLPPFVVHSLLASFVKEMEIKMLNGKQILYNGLGSFLFEDKEDRYLTLWSFEDILHFKISFIDKVHSEDKLKFCSFWRERIEKLVLQIFNFHGKNTYSQENKSSLFEYRIKCLKCPDQIPCEEKPNSEYMYGLLSVRDLQGRKHKCIECPSCGKVTAAKEILKDWFELWQDNADVIDIKNQLDLPREKPIDPSEKNLQQMCELPNEDTITLADPSAEIPQELAKLPEEDKLADLSDEIPPKLIRNLARELCIRDIDIDRLEE